MNHITFRVPMAGDLTHLAWTLAACVGLALSTGAPGARGQDDTASLYEKARLLDEANRDLHEAIRLYDEVVARAETDRRLAAESRYRAGLIHDRLGSTDDALEAFRDVVRRFADQRDVAVLASLRLPATDSGRSPSLSARRVWESADGSGAPSPDGRFLTYVDWDTGELAIRDVATGESRNLTNHGDWQASPNDFPMESVFSPDGRQVAFIWVDHTRAGSATVVRVIHVDGSGERTVFDDPRCTWCRVEAWMPDGQALLLAAPVEGGATELATLNVADGAYNSIRLVSIPAVSFSNVVLSPDGKYAAYEIPADPVTLERDVHIVSLQEPTREEEVIRHPADEFAVGWSPSGGRFLFASDRTGSVSLWAVGFRDGRPASAPEYVKEVGSFWPVGMSRDGRLFYSLDNIFEDLYLANWDPSTGTIDAESVGPIDPRRLGNRRMGRWSPDGSKVAYVRWVSNRPQLVVRELVSGRESAYACGSVEHLYFMEGPQWPADGRHLLFKGVTYDAGPGFYELSLEDGFCRRLTGGEQHSNMLGRWPVFGPGDDALYYAKYYNDPDRFEIARLDRATGEETVVFSGEGHVRQIEITLDRTALLFVHLTESASSIVAQPLGGGMRRTLVEMSGESRLNQDQRLAFTPDGQWLLFQQFPTEDYQARSIWRVPLRGGAAERLPVQPELEDIRWLDVHPDGTRLVFTAGGHRPDMWVLEGLVP